MVAEVAVVIMVKRVWKNELGADLTLDLPGTKD